MYPAMAAGFSTSHVEIVIFFLILTGSIALWVGTSLHRAREEERRRTERAEEYYREIVNTRGLGPTDRALLDRMAEGLHDPRDKSLLLQDQRVFNLAAATLLENDPFLSQGDVATLRSHLGFTGAPPGIAPHATAELEAGASVLLDDSRHNPVPATILPHQGTVLRVRIPEDAPRFSSGRPVYIVYRNAAGIFRFKCTLYGRKEQVLELNHSEKGERMQRRGYFRRSMHLPALLASQLEPESQLETHLTELGGNGATVHNPENQFTRDDAVELTFRPDKMGNITVIARVVRTSRDNSLLHLRFVNVREADRDRIYHRLFQSS